MPVLWTKSLNRHYETLIGYISHFLLKTIKKVKGSMYQEVGNHHAFLRATPLGKRPTSLN